MFNLNAPIGTRVPRGYPTSVRTIADYEIAQLSSLKQRSLRSLRDALALHISATLDRPIRSVIGYYEHTDNFGGCSTCEHWLTVFDVYFKDQSGRTFLYRYDGTFKDLILALTGEPAGAKALASADH